ncbi:MAG: AraC family transcriptional regulator [Bacteroidota bacterium]
MEKIALMITFELIDVIVLVGICQGLFLSLVIQRISNTNKKANAILSLLIIISTLMLVGRVLMVRFFSEWVFLWSIAFDVVIYLFGPLVYLYTKRLLFNEQGPIVLNRLHYLPAVIFFAVACGYLLYYTPTEYFEAYRRGELSLMFDLVLITGMLSNFYYLVRSFGLLLKFRRTEKDAFSFHQSPVRYITFFLIAIGTIMTAWLFGYLNTKLFDSFWTYVGYDAIWIVIPMFIYMIGYFSLKQPELFRITNLKEDDSPKKSRITEEEVQLLKGKLDSLMLNERVYLQGNLTLAEVSEKINTSTNNLSWLLNNTYQTTFYDFINGYRVKEFVRKVANEEHLQHTILALSMDVGFNSKSTFNKAFKSEMNETPSNYIKKHRAA